MTSILDLDLGENECFDWSDLKSMDEGPTVGNDENDRNSGEQPGTGRRKFIQEKFSGADAGTSNKGQDEGNQQQSSFGDEAKQYGVCDWNDLRKFDDDHDDDWFKVQEKRLAEQYGGNFITVKYGDHGRVVYYCELCFAECNAKKSLDLHCCGMKHLKKKDLWEKEGKPKPQVDEDDDRPPPKRKAKKKSGRSRSRSPPLYHARPWDEPRNRHDPSYMHRPMGPMDDGRGRSGRISPRDDYWNGPPDRPRDAPPSDRYRGGPPPPDRFTDKYSSRYRLGDRDHLYDHDRLTNRERDQLPIRDRLRYDGDSQSRRPLSPLLPRYTLDTPQPRKAPSPPKFGKANLIESPAGSLLQKLAECSVKTADDAELGLNVIASLVKSLKEYSNVNGEPKISELLMEAELKIGTVKALKVGMKMLANFGGSSNTSTGMGEIDLFSALSQSSKFLADKSGQREPSYSSSMANEYRAFIAATDSANNASSRSGSTNSSSGMKNSSFYGRLH